MPFKDLFTFLWPHGEPHLLERRRAEAIVARVRAFAMLFAVFTVAWIAVDAAMFDRVQWIRLAIARLVVGAMFASLAIACRLASPGIKQARMCLASLFLIPAAFFVFSQWILEAPPAGGLPKGVAAAYSSVPFVLAAGIGAFPLAVAESAALAGVVFLAEAWALGTPLQSAALAARLDALWLLFLISGAASFAAVSQSRLMAALVQQLIRDPLTGCLRRESGKELLEMQLLFAIRNAAPLAVLFADLDRFKAVNDAFGHEAGDQVLVAAAAALRGLLRESDLVLRWGGEEFVAVLPGTTAAEAVRLLERARAQGFGRLPDGKALTLSVGLAEYRAEGLTRADALVERADQRMYLAKQAGRNRYVSSGGESAPILAPAPAAEAPGAARDTGSAV